MPSEYEALVAALKLRSTPVAEYGWRTRPEGAYYVVQLDGTSRDALITHEKYEELEKRFG